MGFILEDDIADGEYERAVFVRNRGDYLEAALYSHGRTGSDPGTFIQNVSLHIVDSNTLDVIIPARQYAPFHHWYAQTAFETTGPDNRGYPDCNWSTPPPRPFPPIAKCIDESLGITPTFDESPSPTETATDSSLRVQAIPVQRQLHHDPPRGPFLLRSCEESSGQMCEES